VTSHRRMIAIVTWATVAAGAVLRATFADDPDSSRVRSRALPARESAPSVEPWSADLERNVRETDPFARPSDLFAMTSGSPGAPPRPADAQPAVFRMRLSATAGPPWLAIVTSDGPISATFALQVGDTVHGARVLRITADSITVRAGSTTTRYAVGSTWAP
jgi:hypothetical protein